MYEFTDGLYIISDNRRVLLNLRRYYYRQRVVSVDRWSLCLIIKVLHCTSNCEELT